MRRDSEINASHTKQKITSGYQPSSCDRFVPSPSNFCVAASYDHFPSHVVQHTEQFVSASSPALIQTTDGRMDNGDKPAAAASWNPAFLAAVPEQGSTRSFLRSKLTELDDATRCDR